jgi:hypothetical protein
MITFRVDAHKRTHTIVAVDDHGRPVGRPRSAPLAKIISDCCVGPASSACSVGGPSRTADTCPVG